jgi:hypothetical protein
MILSGDEFQCLRHYHKEFGKKPKFLRPKLTVVRDRKQSIDNIDGVVVLSGFTNKKADHFYDYIKPNSEYKLNDLIPSKYHAYMGMIPMAEFKDMKNPQYTVMAYDLMSFKSTIIPFIKNNKEYCPDMDDAFGNVFEFVECLLDKRFKKLLSEYMFVFEEKKENYLWVLNDAIDTCIRIMEGNTKGINKFKLNKYLKYKTKYSIDDFYIMKKFVMDTIHEFRIETEHHGKYKYILELVEYLNERRA